MHFGMIGMLHIDFRLQVRQKAAASVSGMLLLLDHNVGADHEDRDASARFDSVKP